MTKIRVHKKSPHLHEVICYPITKIHADCKQRKVLKQVTKKNEASRAITDCPPAPPRRISSKNSETLKLVTSTRPKSTSPQRYNEPAVTKSNVNILKNDINLKLARQNTHIISKTENNNNTKPKSIVNRVMSTSAPPSFDRKGMSITNSQLKSKSTSVESKIKLAPSRSFTLSRRTLPIEYSNSILTHYGEPHSSVIIEGGVGKRTPITNILDKMTSIDKLWSAEKRNERLDTAKFGKSLTKNNINIRTKPNAIELYGCTDEKLPTPLHKSRDMIRTAEKVQKLKTMNQIKPNSCLPKNDTKSRKQVSVHPSLTKLSDNIPLNPKRQGQVKTAVVTNLKKKNSLENVIIRPRSVPCHEACSKKSKDVFKNNKKPYKSKSIKKICQTTSKLRPTSESDSQFGDTSNEASTFGSYENINHKLFNAQEIKKSHDAVISDSFFQHLFLGRACYQTLTCPLIEHNTTVLQKAKMFQSLPQDISSPKSLNTYLIHRKPVSLSRFKMWDRYPSPAVHQSLRSISWPGRMHEGIKKFDSLKKDKEYGSSSSLASIRSKSEPPISKIYFSQTSRPKSPTILFHKKTGVHSSSKKIMSPTKSVVTESIKSISPKIIGNINRPRKSKTKSLLPSISNKKSKGETLVLPQNISGEQLTNVNADSEKNPSTIFFSETSRPVSPRISKISKSSTQFSRSNSTSPVSLRSPSYRRIHNARLQSNKTSTEKTTNNIGHSHSTGNSVTKDNKNSFDRKKNTDFNLHDPEYDEYIHDIQNTSIRSERFRELNRYYTYLERVAQLEKTTSTSDLRHRKKDEEIVDFDRWKKIRTIERAEEELNNLYRKLKMAQTEKDFLFYPRDLNDFRWSYNRDRSLRIKEKSVEDLRDQFQHRSHEDLDQIPFKDTYKPLWRGTTVAETAYIINKKNESAELEPRKLVKPTVTLQQDSSLSELRKKLGLGSRLWSSLSLEQVNALKHQLNAIYSKELDAKSNKEYANYTIDVKSNKDVERSSVHVRRNSLINSPNIPENETPIKLSKSESIAAISCPITSVKELKNNVNKIQMSLSEGEKRKISQTLGKELLDKINRLDNSSSLTLKQEFESIQHKNDDFSVDNTLMLKTNTKIERPVKAETNVKKRHLVYSNETLVKSEGASHSSASETDTASSDISNKTVIYRGPSKEIKNKVEYFESVNFRTEQTRIINHARDHSDEKELKYDILSSPNQETHKDDSQIKHIVQSQSCTNIKELFGESEKNKFLSLPFNTETRSRSTSPHLEVYATDRRTPDTLQFSSNDTNWRSRSPSPDPERYWRAYLNLVRAGEVRRLARRFDNPSAAGASLRRYRSDPEIARNVLNKSWPSLEIITSRREKSRAMLPVARVPLRPTNRFMPHIDIISKLAALRRRTAPRSRSAEEALECRPGEVDRIRRRFETMSLLGQIYASAPDVRELHEIAPYLAGSWVAHRYPKPSDNNRSINDPSTLVRGRTSPIKKETKVATSKHSIKLNSILKNDTFPKQNFNPSVHRPVSRYEPPRAPPRPPPASWPQYVSPFVTSSRHTVTFQGRCFILEFEMHDFA